MDMLKVSNIRKRFGARTIIDDLSFTVPEHCIYGFIGENGAGKTTTMKMILGLYTMDEGEIYINGEQVVYGQNTTNRFVGYLPDVPEFYNFMTPKEYMQMCADITGMSKSDSRQRIGELLELVGLDRHNKRIKGFSRGMKQRLGIAQALLNRPKLLICDEPTSALDPLGRKEILDILERAKEQTTIIFSTHILTDVERICDEVAILHNGKIALSGKLEDVLAHGAGSGYQIEFCNSEDAQRFIAGMNQEIVQQDNTQQKSTQKGSGSELSNGVCSNTQSAAQIQLVDGIHLTCEGKKETDMFAAMSLLVQMGIQVQKVQMCEPSLEKMFMEVISR